MSKIFIGKEPNQKDFNIIIEDISKKQKEIIEKIKNKFNNFDSEKRKYKLQMLSILWSTYLLTIGSLEEKELSNEDFNIIKSLSSEEEKDKFNDFILIINTFQNSNLINNNQNKELFETNLLQMEKKKSDLKIILNNKEKEQKKEEEKISTCILCTEEFKENDIMNPEIMECKKHAHGSCFINYIEEELNNNRFPIRCPLCAGKERHEINYKTIIDCLLLNDKDNLAAKLENISLNHLAENNSDEITFCPTAGCNYMCSYDKNEFHLNCPMCKKSYCLQCKTEWHEGMNCEEYQRTKNKDENDVKFEEYAKGSKLKQCPKCKRWVEKVSGCDHITCPCGTPFCYRCGRIKESDFDHGCRYCGNSLFGGGGLFGNLINPIRNNIGLFNNNQGGGLFDNNYNNQGGGLFGNNYNNLGGGLFGNNYIGNNYQADLFGNNNNNIFGYQNYDLFGYNNINNQNNNLFVNGINNITKNNNNLFGNNNNLFGNNNDLFGNNNNLFANNNNVQRGGLFGNNINNKGNPLFGNNNNNNQNHGLFGINNNLNFGANNNNNSIFRTNSNNHNSSENEKMFLE